MRVSVHDCCLVVVCMHYHESVCAHGAAGVILAEEGHESQTAFPPAISLGTLQAYICISKEKALLDWLWNR